MVKKVKAIRLSGEFYDIEWIFSNLEIAG